MEVTLFMGFNFWGLHPVASVTATSFGGAVNLNNLYFIFSYSHHYMFLSLQAILRLNIQSFLEAITPTTDPFLVCAVCIYIYIYIYIYILVLFLIMLCNTLYLKFKTKIADNVLKIAISYKKLRNITLHNIIRNKTNINICIHCIA
jgi:hypothetical protein